MVKVISIFLLALALEAAPVSSSAFIASGREVASVYQAPNSPMLMQRAPLVRSISASIVDVRGEGGQGVASERLAEESANSLGVAGEGGVPAPALQPDLEVTSSSPPPASRGPSEGLEGSPPERPALGGLSGDPVEGIILAPLEEMMLYRINSERRRAGLSEVKLEARLVPLARQRSQDMVEKNYFSHVAPDGSNARSLLVASGIGPGVMGEILGRNNSFDPERSVASVGDAFMKSSSHSPIILNPRFVWAGVGAATNPENMKYYTILFLGP